MQHLGTGQGMLSGSSACVNQTHKVVKAQKGGMERGGPGQSSRGIWGPHAEAARGAGDVARSD
eukprot:6534829-Prymnesium_polylepis.1